MFEKLKALFGFGPKKLIRVDSETQQKQIIENHLLDKYQQLSELDKQILFFSVGESGVIISEVEDIFETDSAEVIRAAKSLQSMGLVTFDAESEKPEIVTTDAGQDILDTVIMRKDANLIEQTRSQISDKLYDEDLAIPY